MRKTNFRVGQKVKLVDRRSSIKGDIAKGFNDEMVCHFGKVVTIERVEGKTFNNPLPYVRVEENYWSWDFRFLEPVEEKLGARVYDVDDFYREDCILPCDYNLIKVIQNDKAVICFVEDECNGKTIKAVAKCHEEDTFDLYKGVEICMYKVLRKIADRNLRKF